MSILQISARVYGYVALALVVLMFSSCEKDNASVQKGAVDQQYLESQSYRSFNKQANREQKRTIRSEKNFINFVQNKLKNNKTGTALSVPAIVTEKDIRTVLDGDKQIQQSSVTSLLGYNQIYHPLATAPTGDGHYYLFLTCKVASYKDCLIWFASARGSELVQVQMIATYKKTLAHSVIPEIRVDSSSISVDVQRSVEYPLTVLSSNTLYFTVTDSGQIYRVKHN